MTAGISPDHLLALAVRVAADGAALAQVKREEFITRVRTKSSDTDVVTAADDAVEQRVIDALLAARPGDAILSEESGERPAVRPAQPSDNRATDSPATDNRAHENWATDDQSNRPSERNPAVRWILDPIDGTVNYLYGLPNYAVSLAAEVDGVVVAGVVHNIPHGDVYTATLGGGAYLWSRDWSDIGSRQRPEQERLGGSAVRELSQTLVATGFGYDAQRRRHQGQVLGGLMGLIRDIRRSGSGALDLCFAAAGVVDAYYEKGLSEWDMAAGVLIAREAGLVVSGLHGQPPGKELVLAAPAVIHQELHDLLVKLDAAGGP